MKIEERIFTEKSLVWYLATISIFIVISVFYICFTIFYYEKVIIQKYIAAQKIEQQRLDQEKTNRRVQIAKVYILNNSDRISSKMAEEIAIGVIKRDNFIMLLAIMKVESNYNPTSLSNKGAVGLMQIMPFHLQMLAKQNIVKESRDLFDIEMNISAGDYLWTLMWGKNKGDISKTLTNYYGAFAEVYFNKIIKTYFELKYLFDQSL